MPTGLKQLYEMHLQRLAGIESGAAQRSYTEEEVSAFRREAAQLKAQLEAAMASRQRS